MRMSIDDIGKITHKQHELIHKIENMFNIRFYGKTRKEAQNWISKLLPCYNINLLPCPICGSVDNVLGEVYMIPASIHTIRGAHVICSRCNIEIEERFTEYYYDKYKIDELYNKVRDKWNNLCRSKFYK